MTWNNPSTAPTKPVTLAPRTPQKLVWGASMIWENAEETSTQIALATQSLEPRRQIKPLRPRLAHVLMGAIFGLGR